MVRLVDETLRTRFAQPAGLASPAVTLADPAVVARLKDSYGDERG